MVAAIGSRERGASRSAGAEAVRTGLTLFTATFDKPAMAAATFDKPAMAAATFDKPGTTAATFDKGMAAATFDKGIGHGSIGAPSSTRALAWANSLTTLLSEFMVVPS